MPNHRLLTPSLQLKRLRSHMEATRRDLRQRYWLRVHVFTIAALSLLALWLFSHSLMLLGVDSLAVRYGISLPLAYGWYLLLLRLWAEMLVRRDAPWDGLDVPVPDGAGAPAGGPSFGSGGGGDFGGGGADASFDAPDALPEAAGSLLDGADEGALVLVPLAVLVGAVLLLAGLLGAGVFMVFGVEVLLGVAVEVALAAVAGSFAYRGLAEGWLFAALRHTWRGAAAALVLAVALGAAIDHWLPQARSFPHAVRLIAGG
ncbi:hypothetical protein [Methylibium rhizosphaerae]|uniref:hypothetical protein n=1 Tax=Methylibium rhizosphaerae TaxID=2570323 RepID=UPI001FE808E9|nr:hypothetical protein [Methylibium rhizosphaerae]